MRPEGQDIISVYLANVGTCGRRILLPDVQVLQGAWELKREQERRSALDKKLKRQFALDQTTIHYTLVV